MIRVCHLITDLDPGGAERTLVNVVRHFDPERFRSEVVSLIEPGILADDLRAAGVPVTSLGMRRGRASLSGVARLVRYLHRSRPAILQTWLYHADLLGAVAQVVAPPMNLLWNLRCSDIAAAAGSDRLRTITRLLAWLSKRPDAVIINSTPGQIFHEQIGYRPRRWINLPNGVDTEKFCPRPDSRRELRAKLGLPTDGPIIGLVARYHPMKDHATFLAAAARFAAAFPGARFVMCGRECDSKNQNLTRLIAQAGLSGHVILLGLRNDMEAVYPALDLLSLCSAFGEGFPNVLTEAMACGVPCVATDVGDCREILDDEGLIVPPRDPESLAQAWKGVLARPREDLAARMRARAVYYRIERISQLYEAAYTGLLCQAATRRPEQAERLARSNLTSGTGSSVRH